MEGDVGAIYEDVAAGGGVVTGEVPVAGVFGDGFVEVSHRLVDYFYFAFPFGVSGEDEFGDFCGDFVVGEGGVNFLYGVAHFSGGLFEFGEAFGVDFVEEGVFSAFFEKGDGGFEGDEFAEFCHVDSVAIGVANLGGGGGDDDFRRIGAGEDL